MSSILTLPLQDILVNESGVNGLPDFIPPRPFFEYSTDTSGVADKFRNLSEQLGGAVINMDLAGRHSLSVLREDHSQQEYYWDEFGRLQYIVSRGDNCLEGYDYDSNGRLIKIVRSEFVDGEWIVYSQEKYIYNVGGDSVTREIYGSKNTQFDRRGNAIDPVTESSVADYQRMFTKDQYINP